MSFLKCIFLNLVLNLFLIHSLWNHNIGPVEEGRDFLKKNGKEIGVYTIKPSAYLNTRNNLWEKSRKGEKRWFWWWE